MNRNAGLRLDVVPTAVILFALAAPAALPAAQDARAAAAELTRVKLASDRMMPRIASQVLPDYPPDAAGAGGTVHVEVVVGTKGDVIHAWIAKTSDSSSALGRAALEAARAWKFKPVLTNRGDPLTVLVILRFEFAAPRALGQSSRVSARLAPVQVVPLPAGGRQPVPGAALPFEPRAGQVGMQWPKVVRQITPDYTPNAMRAKVQGTVQMDAVILEDGSVGQTRVTKSLDSELDEQALIAARYWLFEAGTKDGKPVAMKVVLALEFKLH